MKIMENKKDIVVKQNDYLSELKNTKEACKLLMQEKHYETLGPAGIFAIMETAKSLGVDPRQALGGGLYYVRGKVEMSARMMNALIRSKKHSITRDKRSDDTICILHGKRADNGDMWSESFSLEEAKRAGLVKANGPWVNFTRDMLFARALSRLARQLFPDIIGNCYVEGEISLDPNIKGETAYQNDDQNDSQTKALEVSNKRNKEEVEELTELFKEDPDYREEIEAFLLGRGIEHFEDMPLEMYNKVLKRLKERVEAKDEDDKN